MKLLQQCFLFFIVVVIPGHNLGNSQVSVNRTIGPTLVYCWQNDERLLYCMQNGEGWLIVDRMLRDWFIVSRMMRGWFIDGRLIRD